MLFKSTDAGKGFFKIPGGTFKLGDSCLELGDLGPVSFGAVFPFTCLGFPIRFLCRSRIGAGSLWSLGLISGLGRVGVLCVSHLVCFLPVRVPPRAGWQNKTPPAMVGQKLGDASG